ncbi:histidine kinase [Natrarchaeobius chitinivorans]|uniref:histidine kinase n=2 Tax=Natrarchaeobius chitinivorans TaxID=1679083 RepID=A0A3N6LRM8_NATCH|nr:histidine kinase [Natrarchaeobius chitinivorans]
MLGGLSSVGSMRLGYALVFGVGALVCFVSLRRTAAIEHEDTRRGLYWLLLASGVWAATHVGYLVASSPRLQYVLFTGGLIAGIAAVGPWLYFCSAYTGRSLHRNETIRRIAVAVFLVIVGVKVTNPIHEQYFVTELVTTPFPTLQIHHEPLHWVVMGFAYALSFVGFFMLLELFVRVSSDTTPLFALVGLTGLPVVFDVLGVVSPLLLDITYSPLGVAAFSIGVFYVYLERFQIVRATSETDQPVVILDDRDQVRDYNGRALDLFPSLSGSIGRQFETLLPDVADVLESEEQLLEADVSEEIRFYSVSENPFSADRTRIGRAVVFTDVTHREQYRLRLEQQNDQLERFANVVSHDLRNPLSIAQGRTQLAVAENETDHLEDVVEALDRMEELIDDILVLARDGASIDDVQRVDLSSIAGQSWTMIAAEDAELAVDIELGTVLEADPDRLQQLFENLYRNAIDHGDSDVTITVGELSDSDGFYVEDDGPGIPAEIRADVFEPGYTTADAGTGLGLSIVRDVAAGHGWSVEATDGPNGGARFEVTVPSLERPQPTS